MSHPRIALMLLGTLAGLTPSGFSQIYHRHNATVFGGAAQPSGDLDNFFSTSFLTGVEYNFRFHQNFQVDAGYEAIFGAAGVSDWLPTAFGNLRIRDYQSFIPFGGRVILPLRSEQFTYMAEWESLYAIRRADQAAVSGR
jgi:hypothetical protein